MKQFCPYLLCCLAATAKINYSHLSPLTRLTAGAVNTLVKWNVRQAHLASLSARAAEEPAAAFWECSAAATAAFVSSADSRLLGSLNVADLLVSIFRLISALQLATATKRPFVPPPLRAVSQSHRTTNPKEAGRLVDWTATTSVCVSARKNAQDVATNAKYFFLIQLNRLEHNILPSVVNGWAPLAWQIANRSANKHPRDSRWSQDV